MSALLRKMIRVDENLSKVIGFDKGELVSYTDVTKGIHGYIKKKNLRKELDKKKAAITFCFNCGADVQANSPYCDRCGRKQ
jgi:chromatin remodeling complex protein RSC6